MTLQINKYVDIKYFSLLTVDEKKYLGFVSWPADHKNDCFEMKSMQSSFCFGSIAELAKFQGLL